MAAKWAGDIERGVFGSEGGEEAFVDLGLLTAQLLGYIYPYFLLPQPVVLMFAQKNCGPTDRSGICLE